MDLSADKRFDLLNGEVTRFCFVRNPYAKLASVWMEKIRQKEPGYAKYWAIVAKRFSRSADVCPTFKEFATWVVDNKHKKDTNLHWLPMKELLLPDIMNYTDIIKIEKVKLDINFIGQLIKKVVPIERENDNYFLNPSLPSSLGWQSLYDAELAEAVADFYKDDFDWLQYDRDSWRKGGNAHSDKIPADNKTLVSVEFENIALRMIRERNDSIVFWQSATKGCK